MTPNFGEHAVFIWTAYGLVFGALALLIAWSVLSFYRADRKLKRLEAQLAALSDAGAKDDASKSEERA